MDIIKFLVILLLTCHVVSCQSSEDDAVNTVDNEIPQTIKFLALGDSYTIGQSVSEAERWPVQLSNKFISEGKLSETPFIIARTGWRTDQLKQAIMDSEIIPNEYNLVSLLIGVNNQYQGRSPEDYAIEFEELLNMAITLVGGEKKNVFVVSIPDYGYTPFGLANQAYISKEIDEFNSINRSISERIGVSYFYITDISRRGLSEPSLLASDGLHPSGIMYAEWVDVIYDGLHLK